MQGGYVQPRVIVRVQLRVIVHAFRKGVFYSQVCPHEVLIYTYTYSSLVKDNTGMPITQDEALSTQAHHATWLCALISSI